MKDRYSSGQALLIILLIMAVALTIGLSVVSQSIVDIRLSQQQEESARAFSAAEAGLESLLATGVAPESFEGFTITTETKELGNSDSFIFPKEIKAGDIQIVWLVGHNSDGEPDPGVDQFNGTEIRVFWGNSGTPSNNETTPALEATLFYKEGNDYRTIKYTGDPNTNRRTTNNFQQASDAGYTLQQKTFQFRKMIQNMPAGVMYYALRLKLIYNSDQPHILGVRGIGDNIPLQGHCYQVKASKQETGISRKVEQCQLYKSLPSIFDYVLFSESDLAK